MPFITIVCAPKEALRRSDKYMQGRMRVPHSLFVDDCADAMYVADRDNGAVHRIQIRGKEAGGEPPRDRHNMNLSDDQHILLSLGVLSAVVT